MTELPAHFTNLRDEFPEVAAAYDALGDAAHRAGPLDDKTRQLIKLAMAIAGEYEGATHAHVRRALQIGITPEEIKHVVLLAMTTLGFPATVKAYSWVQDILDKE